MDWSFGGWTPLSESAKMDFATFPLHQGRSGEFAVAQPLHQSPPEPNSQVPSSGGQSHARSSNSIASNASNSSSTSLDSSSSSQSYRVVEFVNQAPQPYLGPNGNGAEQLSAIAAGALYHLQQQSAQYFPGLPPQPYNRHADTSPSSYQVPVPPQVPVPKIKVAVEPKPLREARIEAYKVIEHLEANADKVLNSAKPALADVQNSPPYQTENQPGDYNNNQQLQPQYSEPQYQQNQQGQPQQQQQYQQQQQQQPQYHTGQIQYKQAVNLYDNNQLNQLDSQQDYPQMPGNGKTKTIVLPVKEVGKDYVTVPVAVETDADQVLTAEDIKEIENAVLKAIPETISHYADKIPDHLYETALPINEVSKGESFKTIELPPVIIPAGEGPHYGQVNDAGGGWSAYMPPMANFMPNFISALSPSKGKISDLLRPLLSLVRPIQPTSPLPPASPAQRVKGIADVPIIPGNAPYAGSHRPENLDVIHIIANHKSGPEPTVYHINQLAPSPSLSFARGQQNNELNFRS